MGELFASDYGRVVGYYDFVSTPAVRVTGLSSLEAAAHAEHEQAHFTLAHQTTHGHLILFGNKLLARSNANAELRGRINELIDDGRDVHERFAVYMTLAPNVIYHRQLMARLSERYHRYLKEAAELPPEHLRGTHLGRALFYAAVVVSLSPNLPQVEQVDDELTYFHRCFRSVIGVSKRWRAVVRWICDNTEDLLANVERIGTTCEWPGTTRTMPITQREDPSSVPHERAFVVAMADFLWSHCIAGAGVCTFDTLEHQIEPFRRWNISSWCPDAGLPGVHAEDYARLLSMFNERPVPQITPRKYRNYVIRKNPTIGETAILSRLRKTDRPTVGVLRPSWPGFEAPVVQWILNEEEANPDEVVVDALVVRASALNWEVLAIEAECLVLAVAATALMPAETSELVEIVANVRAAGIRVVAMFAWNPVLLLEALRKEGPIRYPIACLGRKLTGPCDIIAWSSGDGVQYAQLAGISTLLGVTELVQHGVVTFEHADGPDGSWLEEVARVMTYICGEQQPSRTR